MLVSYWLKTDGNATPDEIGTGDNNVGITALWYSSLQSGAAGYNEIAALTSGSTGEYNPQVIPTPAPPGRQRLTNYAFVLNPIANAAGMEVRLRYWQQFTGATYWDDVSITNVAGNNLFATSGEAGPGPGGPAEAPARWLTANVPNPFSGATEIRFALPEAQEVTLEVYDLLGRRVALLADAEPMTASRPRRRLRQRRAPERHLPRRAPDADAQRGPPDHRRPLAVRAGHGARAAQRVGTARAAGGARRQRPAPGGCAQSFRSPAMRSRVFFLVLAACALAPGALAQTGKVSGRVVDAATGEPLIGGRRGRRRDGPGRGHRRPTATTTSWRSGPGPTPSACPTSGTPPRPSRTSASRSTRRRRWTWRLAEQSVEGEEVVVQAVRPIVQRDRTSSQASVSAEELAALPVQSFQDVVNLQAGVVEGHFRGGRIGEVAYLVDGVPVNDVYDQSFAFQVENQAIQEVQVISGTFNAEYGQAQSGVVNIVTKDGGDEYQASLSAYAGDYGTTRSDLFERPSTFSPLENVEANGVAGRPGARAGRPPDVLRQRPGRPQRRLPLRPPGRHAHLRHQRRPRPGRLADGPDGVRARPGRQHAGQPQLVGADHG